MVQKGRSLTLVNFRDACSICAKFEWSVGMHLIKREFLLRVNKIYCKLFVVIWSLSQVMTSQINSHSSAKRSEHA